MNRAKATKIVLKLKHIAHVIMKFEKCMECGNTYLLVVPFIHEKFEEAYTSHESGWAKHVLNHVRSE